MRAAEDKFVRYQVFGPFPFEREGLENHANTLGRFWKQVDVTNAKLANAVGVYVWTYRSGKNRIPWNVGLTDRQGFKERFPQKAATFLRFYEKQNSPVIEVFLLALLTKSGGFRKPTKSKRLSRNHWLEGLLIGSALSANPDLSNYAKTGYLKNTIVDVYLNDKKSQPSEHAHSFGALFKV